MSTARLRGTLMVCGTGSDVGKSLRSADGPSGSLSGSRHLKSATAGCLTPNKVAPKAAACPDVPGALAHGGLRASLTGTYAAAMAHGQLPQAEYEAIFSRVPRLTVEVVISAADGSVLLSRRLDGPCQGLWHIPGGTVRFGERLAEAARRVPLQELGLEVAVGGLIGYIEYPSHLALGDWPVGIAFGAELSPSSTRKAEDRPGVVRWFSRLPDEMHEEQKMFLKAHGLAS